MSSLLWTILLLVLSLLLLPTTPASAWVSTPRSTIATLQSRPPRRRRRAPTTSLSLYQIESNPWSDALGSVPFFHAPSSSEDWAAIFSDIAHVASDLVVLFEPETVLLRSSVVVGRLLDMSSDYIEDSWIRSDELAFDVPLLIVGSWLLWKSAVPLVKAYFTKLDELDMHAYEFCFEPVGVSLLQFQSMKATGCFEWMSFLPGEVLIDEDCELGDGWQYLYWQYDGSVIRSHKGNVFGVMKRTKGRHIDNPNAAGLLGDSRFLCKLDEHEALDIQQNGGKIKQAIEGTEFGDTDDDTRVFIKREEASSSMFKFGAKPKVFYPMATTTVGPQGATVLRIDSYQLFDLMDHDEKLESSIRKLLLKSLQRKIGNLLRSQDELFAERERICDVVREMQEMMDRETEAEGEKPRVDVTNANEAPEIPVPPSI